MENPPALWREYKQQECPKTLEVKPCRLRWLNVQEIEGRFRYDMISKLNVGNQNDSKYSPYPESEIQIATVANRDYMLIKFNDCYRWLYKCGWLKI
jgi:hypothetical protein